MTGWSILKHESNEKCTANGEGSEVMDVCIDNSDDDVNWGDCDGKLRCLFDQVLMMLLRGVYAKSGIRPIPALLGDGQPVDLCKLFCLVRDRGGFRSVSEDRLWGLIAEKFGFDYKLCASLKLMYFKYLDELDQWLDRITRDRVSATRGYECRGNLGLLSLELEQRFRSFSAIGKDLVLKDDEAQYDEICKRIDVALKGTLQLEDAEKDEARKDGVVRYTLDDDGKGHEIMDFGKENLCDRDDSRKRKRDVFAEMLSWMIKIAKNPCHPSVGRLPAVSRWKENGDKEFWSVTLSVREARLRRKYSDSNDDHSALQQKKNRMHPSMYEDDNFPLYNSGEGLRSSKRRLSFVKTPPCHCCQSGSDKQCQSERHSISPPVNECPPQESANTDVPATKSFPAPVDDYPPVENHVRVGSQFQAEVPAWTGVVSESDSKWLGTEIWVPDSEKEGSSLQVEVPGRGRQESCNCPFPGSVECNRFHIAEKRLKLRQSLGLAFYHWKFDRMGEEVCLSWSAEEEERFKKIVKLHKPHLGRRYFPSKRRTDLVSYYHNVYLIRRRSYQNRVTPKEIDSDDDETEFGSVGDPFGYNAVKVPRSEALICRLNEQEIEFD